MQMVSWFFYAAAGVCFFFSLGLALLGKKQLRVIYGHLGIGFGLAIICAAAGYKFGNTLTLLENGLLLGIVAAGYAIFFFGRRRARDEKRFLDATTAADQKLSAND